jgi:hypothetical protein
VEIHLYVTHAGHDEHRISGTYPPLPLAVERRGDEAENGIAWCPMLLGFLQSKLQMEEARRYPVWRRQPQAVAGGPRISNMGIQNLEEQFFLTA